MNDRDAFVVRDPIWNTIRLEGPARRIVNSAAFQRLRYIKQLGLAHLVYPGATHTRFDHALGVYHLMRRALTALSERGALPADAEPDLRIVPLAGLLHDVGHYPFSHALEELEEIRPVGHHEAVVGRFLADPEIAEPLRGVAADAPERIEALIRGRSESPLQGLVSGSLDLDKIEYLKRDARFCGVPYGEVDVDRLLSSLLLAQDPESGRIEVGVHEKGVAALESLLFAKYQMFRNVYWHHAIRAATVMYKRVVSDALSAGLFTAEELVGETDEALLFRLEARAREDRSGSAVTERVATWIGALRARRLPKRAGEVIAADLDGSAPGRWLAMDTPLKRTVEDRLARQLDLPEGTVFLDYPEKRGMFGLDLLILRRSGEVIRVGERGRRGLIRLPRVADELYRSARVLRLFTLGKRREVAPEALARVALLDEEGLRQRIAADEPLLQS